MSIDYSNLGATGYGQVAPVPGQGGDQTQGTSDTLTKSTLSPSQQEALMMFSWMISAPQLIQPNTAANSSTSSPTNVSDVMSAIGARFAQIGSQMWDTYLNMLAEQKKRIQEYLHSAAYRNWVEDHKPQELKSQFLSNVEYQKYLTTLPSTQRSDELVNRASNLWAHYIEGVQNHVNTMQSIDPKAVDNFDPKAAASFAVSSYVISSAFIGNYMNIVDVASTKMVTVNPIQDAATSVKQIIPPDFQDSTALTINLFATGVMYQSALQLIPNINGKEPADKMDLTMAKAYADGIADKVDSNEINYFLMALMVNSTENGKPLTNKRINQMAATVKLAMLSVALAVLYKAETKWIKGADFQALVNGDLQPRSDEETRLVDLIKQLRGENILSPQEWDTVMTNLAAFFDSNPNTDDMLNPMKVYAAISGTINNSEAQAA